MSGGRSCVPANSGNDQYEPQRQWSLMQESWGMHHLDRRSLRASQPNMVHRQAPDGSAYDRRQDQHDERADTLPVPSRTAESDVDA